VQGERGREEERGNPRGEGDQRKGRQQWDVLIYMVRRLAEFKKSKKTLNIWSIHRLVIKGTTTQKKKVVYVDHSLRHWASVHLFTYSLGGMKGGRMLSGRVVSCTASLSQRPTFHLFFGKFDRWAQYIKRDIN
jgi:hypothetical protein